MGCSWLGPIGRGYVDGTWISRQRNRKLVEKSPSQTRGMSLEFCLFRRSRATIPRLHQGDGVRFLRDIFSARNRFRA